MSHSLSQLLRRSSLRSALQSSRCPATKTAAVNRRRMTWGPSVWRRAAGFPTARTDATGLSAIVLRAPATTLPRQNPKRRQLESMCWKRSAGAWISIREKIFFSYSRKIPKMKLNINLLSIPCWSLPIYSAQTDGTLKKFCNLLSPIRVPRKRDWSKKTAPAKKEPLWNLLMEKQLRRPFRSAKPTGSLRRPSKRPSALIQTKKHCGCIQRGSVWFASTLNASSKMRWSPSTWAKYISRGGGLKSKNW